MRRGPAPLPPVQGHTGMRTFKSLPVAWPATSALSTAARMAEAAALAYRAGLVPLSTGMQATPCSQRRESHTWPDTPLAPHGQGLECERGPFPCYLLKYAPYTLECTMRPCAHLWHGFHVKGARAFIDHWRRSRYVCRCWRLTQRHRALLQRHGLHHARVSFSKFTFCTCRHIGHSHALRTRSRSRHYM